MNEKLLEQTLEQITPGYGYVLLSLVLIYFLLFWQGFMVGRQRKVFKVEHPAMYSDTEPVFNCYQVMRKLTRYICRSKPP